METLNFEYAAQASLRTGPMSASSVPATWKC